MSPIGLITRSSGELREDHGGRPRLAWWTLVVLVLGAAIAGGALGRVLLPGPAAPRTVRGMVSHVSPDRTQMGFVPDGHSDPDGLRSLREQLVDLRYGGRNAVTAYEVGEVAWADARGDWHAGTPPACLVSPAPGSQRVELGLVQVRGAHGAPGGPVVAWLRCL
jgi:hypothetical protein